MSSQGGQAGADDRRRRVLVVVLVVALALLAAGVVAGAVSWLRGSGTDDYGPVAGGAAGGVAGVAGVDIVTVPINTARDPFTAPVGEDLAITPVTLPSPTRVPGGAVGLYGGTLDASSCNRDRLEDFLTTNRDEGAAWAATLGVPVTGIASYLRTLTPLLLRSDTLVVNHGFKDGVATPFTAVLQAGNAVLVDGRGVPVVRCYCGNPLRAAPDRVDRATFSGPTWSTWDPDSIAVITENPTPVADFTVVDVRTGARFTRPRGSGGGEDRQVSGGSTTAVPEPSTAEPSTSQPATRPTGEEETLLVIDSIQGVSNRPTAPSTFTIEQGVYVTKIVTYHYLNGGSPPGTIALRAADGTVYGPWRATGSPGQGGVANAYWTALPGTALPPGTYTVVDSNPATWSWAPDTRGRGITTVWGIYTAVMGGPS